MFRLALKNVRHNPKRLILTAVAVALGVALVAATHIFTNSLSSGFNALFNDIYDTVDVVVEVDPTADNQYPAGVSAFHDADVAAVAGVDGVAQAAGTLTGQGQLLDATGQPPNAGQGGPPSLIFPWSGNARLDSATLVDGTAPTTTGQVVIDVDAFAKRGLSIGDTIKMASQTGVTDLTVTGTARFGENNSTQGATLMWSTIDTVRAIADVDGFDGIQATTVDGADDATVAAAVQKVIPAGTRALTGTQKAAEQAAQFDQVLQYVDIFTLAFALIALFVGAYIIVNTFRIIVTQRTREFGLLRAIGVTGKQVRGMILFEATFIGVIASTLGIALGWALAGVITFALERVAGNNIFGALTVPPDALAWGYGLGMLVTLVSALLPAIHASRISPMEALRESGTQSKKPLRARNIVGGALALVGVIVFGVGLFAGLDKPYIYVGIGGVMLVLGATLLAAQVLVPLAYGLRGTLTRLFRLDGKLAANNIHREPRRSANTAAALMIGVMLLALVATFTQSLKATFSDQFSTADAELFALATGDFIPPGAVDVIDATTGVRYVSPTGVGNVDFQGSSKTLGIVDPAIADTAFEYPHDRPFSELNGGVFIDPSVQALGYSVGDEVTLKGPAETLTLPITGLYERDGDANFFVAWDTGTKLMGKVDVAQLMIGVDKGADVAAVQTAITDNLAADYPLVQVQDASQLQQFVNQVIDLFLNIISALLGSALVIAILGVANTLLLSVTERTREIGLLRAVGLRKRSVWRMITIESLVMALFGTILGMILGVSIGAALVVSLKDLGFSSFAIPWLNLVIYTVLAAIAGVLAALWPARRAANLDILEAIATDG